MVAVESRPSLHPASSPHPDLLIPDLPDIEEDLPLFAPTASTSQQGASQWSLEHPNAAVLPERRQSSVKGKGKLVDFDEVELPRRSVSTQNGQETINPASTRHDGLIEERPLVSPLGAKAIASVTGAVMTSLLSKLSLSPSPHPLSYTLFSDTIRRSEDSTTNTSTQLGEQYSAQHRLLPDRDHSRNWAFWCAKHDNHLYYCHLASRTDEHIRHDLPFFLWRRVSCGIPSKPNRPAILPILDIRKYCVLWSIGIRWCGNGNTLCTAATRGMPASVKVVGDLGRDDDAR
jgi:hypothetical protein